MRVLGLKVRSGFAIGVIVDGRSSSWKIERRLDATLTAGEEHYARFPFHPLVDIGGEAGAAESRRCVAVVETAARRALDALLPTVAPLAHAVVVAASLTSPEKVANPHMRVHAREGELYRRVVCEALARQGIATTCVSEKTVHALSAQALGIDTGELIARITAAGRGAIKPWRSDEKFACAAALSQLQR